MLPSMTLGQRIRERREALDLTQENVARHFDITREAVNQWEQDKTTPRGRRLRDLGDLLQVSVDWLTGGKGMPTNLHEAPTAKNGNNGRMLVVEELDVLGANSSSAANHPSESLSYDHEKVRARWHVPSSFIRMHTPAPAERVKFITAKGDSNAPKIMPGDKLLVDLDDTKPTPPGFFAIWDGFGEVIKRLEMVPYSDPPRIVLKSANSDYEQRELPLDQVIINGRVVGHWGRL